MIRTVKPEAANIRTNAGKVIAPSPVIVAEDAYSPSVQRLRTNAGKFITTTPSVVTETVYHPPFQSIRRNAGKLVAKQTIDPYASNVSLLTYCNKNAKSSGSTFTDETGKTITVNSSGNPPAQCFIAHKSGNAFCPGQGQNSSSLANYYRLAANQSAFWFGAGDWTMEFLVSSENWYSGASYFGTIFFAQRNLSDQYGIQFDYYNNNLRLAGNGANGLIFSWTPSNNIIYYVAIKREEDDIICAVDGVQRGTTGSWAGVTLNEVTSPNRFGGDSFNSHGECSFHGIRITKGVARDILSIPTLPFLPLS